MNSREHRIRPGRLMIRLAAVLALLVTTWAGAAQPSTAQSGTSDIAIVTTENGSLFFDACFVLVGYSNEGCDVNRDGDITFDDIPYGSYTLRQTQNLGGGRYVSESTIYVNGASDADGLERFYVSVSTGGAGRTGTSNVAIITTASGQPFYDACFVLVDYSNQGCDVNRDGMITFEAIPHGSYTLRQTMNLGSGRYVNDTTIHVSGAADVDGWERFYVSVDVPTSAPSSSAPIDISLITRDPADGRLLTGVCYVLVGYSNEGCDENSDGQVTFAAIPPGTYTVRQTQTPAGYPAINDYEITVQNVDGIPLGFLVRQATEQNAPGTRNVSIVFVDIATKQRVVSSTCVQFVGASNVGCDEDLIDGQVDFLDVPTGTWEYEFSNIPAGWVIDPAGADFGPMPPLVVDASSSMPSHLIRFIPVAVPGSESANQPESAPLQHSEMYSLHIRSMTQLGGTTFGAHFTVSAENGTVLGSCTLEGDATSPLWQYCSVNVPVGIVVTVWQDPTSLPDGLVASENPIQFDTTYPTTTPHSIDVAFINVPE